MLQALTVTFKEKILKRLGYGLSMGIIFWTCRIFRAMVQVNVRVCLPPLQDVKSNRLAEVCKHLEGEQSGKEQEVRSLAGFMWDLGANSNTWELKMW